MAGEPALMELDEAGIDGRRAFVRILKYIRAWHGLEFCG
jgi:hypothetical protein